MKAAPLVPRLQSKNVRGGSSHDVPLRALRAGVASHPEPSSLFTTHVAESNRVGGSPYHP